MDNDIDLKFDYWLKLYEDNKVEFERKRLEVLEKEISKIEDPVMQQRMRGMIWRFEQDLRNCKNDTERFNRVVSYFWRQVNRFRDAIK